MISSAKQADLVVTVSNVSKDYELHRSDGARFLRQLLGRYSPIKPRIFPAVHDVSFELHPGEAIAVLGRNGAGKSTLLQIITGLLQPSAGSIALPKRVIGLLELGSGFNPDFTGRENITINAAILGLRRDEIRAKFDDIIAFADIGDYIDQPVRTYSSGMFLRLAFGVATAASPDLLLVDEVLAVGDIFFRQKCYDRLRELRQNGTAVILVTHSLVDAAEFCEKGLVLSEGRVAFQGKSSDAVQYYMAYEQDARTGQRGGAHAATASSVPSTQPKEGAGSWLSDPASIDLTGMLQVGEAADARVERTLITDMADMPMRHFQQGDWARIRVAFKVNRRVERAVLGIVIKNERNVPVHGKNSLNVEDAAAAGVESGRTLELVYDVKLDLDCGEYTLGFALADIDEGVYERRSRLTPSELHTAVKTLRFLNNATQISIRARAVGHPCTFSHYGIADLPSKMEAIVHP